MAHIPSPGRFMAPYTMISLVLHLNLFDLVLFQLHGEHTALQPCGTSNLSLTITIAVPPGTHLYLSEVKYLWVKCLAKDTTLIQQCPSVERGGQDISLIIMHPARPELGSG